MNLADAILELYRRVSFELPQDLVRALIAARSREETGSAAQLALDEILKNIELAKSSSRPICQDTGMPIFYVSRPVGTSEREISAAIESATREATKAFWLRPNAVDSVTGRNTGDNVGEGLPLIHFSEREGRDVVIDAMLKGGGSENVGGSYKLPDATLGAGRDLEGVRRCVLDAVVNAQGRACPPYVVAAAVGGAKDATAALAKRQLLRPMDDRSPVVELAQLEARLLDEINTLGIGPAGLGGRTTALGVKLAAMHRHPASFFVEVAFGCWALRRGKLIVDGDEARYE